MRTYFSPWQTSTANVTKPFLRKPANPLRLNICTLQKHVNNHIDNVNGVTFVTRKHMSSQGAIFSCYLQTADTNLIPGY